MSLSQPSPLSRMTDNQLRIWTAKEHDHNPANNTSKHIKVATAAKIKEVIAMAPNGNLKALFFLNLISTHLEFHVTGKATRDLNNFIPALGNYTRFKSEAEVKPAFPLGPIVTQDMWKRVMKMHPLTMHMATFTAQSNFLRLGVGSQSRLVNHLLSPVWLHQLYLSPVASKARTWLAS